MSKSNAIALTSSRERPAGSFSGYLMLILLLVAIVWQVWGIVNLAQGNDSAFAHIFAVVAAPILLLFIACGFYMLQPNQAAAITLFGAYRGSDRTTGLRWIWPWMIRKKLSVRANNFISEKIKVNDQRGNQIEMEAH